MKEKEEDCHQLCSYSEGWVEVKGVEVNSCEKELHSVNEAQKEEITTLKQRIEGLQESVNEKQQLLEDERNEKATLLTQLEDKEEGFGRISRSLKRDIKAKDDKIKQLENNSTNMKSTHHGKMAALSKKVGEQQESLEAGAQLLEVASMKDMVHEGNNIAAKQHIEDLKKRNKDLLREHEQLSYLTSTGAAIRSRKLEWEKTVQDGSITLVGDQEAHYGNPVADASLYEFGRKDSERNSVQRDDVETYEALYGWAPSFVWIHRDCKKSGWVLLWHATMKQVHKPRHMFDYTTTQFYAVFCQFKAHVAG